MKKTILVLSVLLLVLFTGCTSSSSDKKDNNTTKSADTALKSLTISIGTLSPVFSKEILAYSATVANKEDKVNVTAVSSSDKAKVTGAGEIALKVGVNNVTITVKAEDGSEKIYTIAITRVENGVIPVEKDNDATLKSLTISAGTLSPMFSKDVTGYTTTVANTIDRVTITAAANSNKATVTGTGETKLELGLNKIEIKVKAEDGAEKVYTLLITRLESGVIPVEKDKDASIKQLSISGSVKITPELFVNVFEYTAEVENNVSKITVNAVANSSKATITGTGEVQLTVGPNKVKIVITAEDGTVNTYTIIITRKGGETEPVKPGTLSGTGTLSTQVKTKGFNGKGILYVENGKITKVTSSGTGKDEESGMPFKTEMDMTFGYSGDKVISTTKIMNALMEGFSMKSTVVITYKYNGANLESAEEITTSEFPMGTNKVTSNYTYKYDSNGRIVEILKDKVESKTFIYSSTGSLEKIVEGDTTKTYTYVNNRIIKIAEVSKNETIITEYKYDSIGNLTDVIIDGESSPVSATGNAIYDAHAVELFSEIYE